MDELAVPWRSCDTKRIWVLFSGSHMWLPQEPSVSPACFFQLPGIHPSVVCGVVPVPYQPSRFRAEEKGAWGAERMFFPIWFSFFFVLSVGRAGIGATCVLKGGDLGDGMSSACAGLCVCGVCAHTHVQLCGRTSDTSPLCPPSWALPALPLVWNPKVCWWWGGV